MASNESIRSREASDFVAPANRASSIGGKLHLATLRQPSVEQLRDILRDINDLRREVVEIGKAVAEQ